MLSIGNSFSILYFFTPVDKFKKLEETIHVHVRYLTQDSTFDLFLVSFQFFCPKFKLPNLRCGLSASAAYTPVFTVIKNFLHFLEGHHISNAGTDNRSLTESCAVLHVHNGFCEILKFHLRVTINKYSKLVTTGGSGK